MDRRRFKPSAEGLEGRALLSLFGGKSPATNTTISIQDLPETFQQKLNRIDHLPFHLQQEDPNRYLPPATIQQLQTDMRSVIAGLHAPTTPVVDAFNTGLRHLMPYKTLSRENARLVNHSFGKVLERAGATPEQVSNLKRDMNELARVDAQSTQPASFARQDYALVLQTTLSVGRPMQTPTPAILAANDGVRAKDNRSGVTHDYTPTLVGTYAAGATKIGYIRMQVLDQNDTVVGTGTVDSTGNYTVKLSPLADGTYSFRTRAEDEVGHLSLPSLGAFRLKVVSRPATHVTTTATAVTSTSPATATTVTTTATTPVATTTTTTTTPVASHVSTTPNPLA